jgi:hypothetical protein
VRVEEEGIFKSAIQKDLVSVNKRQEPMVRFSLTQTLILDRDYVRVCVYT